MDTERVLFIIPPHLKFEDFTNPSFNARVEKKESGRQFGNVLTDMPLGAMSLSSYLKKQLGEKNIQIRLLDFNVLLNLVEDFEFSSFKDYFQHVLKNGVDTVSGEKWSAYSPTLIGTTVLFSPSYDNFIDIVNCSREIYPNSTIFAGGGIPTTMYLKIFRETTAIDALCFAEGEKTLLEYIQSKDKKKYLEESPYWITPNKKDWSSSNFKTNYIYDLDEIPFYDYDLVRTEHYSLNPALTAYAGVYQKKQNYHYMTSRGCVYTCNFCASHKVNGRTMRYHSVARVREDLTRLKEVYGAKTIVIQDDHFMGDKDRALEIINIIGELQLTVVFQNSLTLFALNRHMLEAMKRCGVKHLMLSVESGSARVLREIMHKPLTLPIIEQVASDCRDLGIYTDTNILIGNIRETEQDIEDARNFLRVKAPVNWFKLFIATPLAGSEFYEEAREKGMIEGDLVNFDYKKANISTEFLKRDRIEELQYELNLELNFVYNHDVRIGEEKMKQGKIEDSRTNYEIALLGFLNAIRSRSDHVFAHHFASICYDRLDQPEKSDYHRSKAILAAENPAWGKWLDKFPQVRSAIGKNFIALYR